MYMLFEKKSNPISLDEMQLYYKKQYSGEMFHKGTEISNSFEKFMILLLNRYVYFLYNEPVYLEEFNYNIKYLPVSLQKEFVDNNIKKIFQSIKEYLYKNNNLIQLTWEIDKEISLGASNYIWIRNYKIFSIYDLKAPKKFDI